MLRSKDGFLRVIPTPFLNCFDLNTGHLIEFIFYPVDIIQLFQEKLLKEKSERLSFLKKKLANRLTHPNILLIFRLTFMALTFQVLRYWRILSELFYRTKLL